MKIIIANSAKYFSENLEKSFNSNGNIKYLFFKKKEELNLNNLRSINPRYIFCAHWSYIIPEEVFFNFECIIFHMTDLPFGRGGSPLQNLIARKIYNTKVSAIRCEKELDAGDIYLQKDLNLFGSAQEIYLRANKVISEMINEIIEKTLTPVPQLGDPILFQRRKPDEGNIEKLYDLESIFDYIRMLDADGYPNAFIETKDFCFEFSRASFKGDKILADVIIRRKECQK